ncbi:MAG: aminotransferase class V-fold PLP-dependent enzyme [Synergistaceae bacterium]|jgi:selenocysteine lyase/cysteine desulfurase|nr:aminotransferase class V-fold PLP-dependent enzyme [Synergistaceae bacterium]
METEKSIYLDSACAGIYPDEVLSCAGDFVELMRNRQLPGSEKTNIMRSYLATCRERVARLINCSPDEIALVESTTHGLGIVSEIVELAPEDNVLICDLEYQASYLCLRPKQRKVGFEIRRVENVGGEITAEIFGKYIDQHTKLIVLASVQEINGFRADVREISELAHRSNCLVAVDGIQEVGAMRVDVRETGADFYCTGSKKWICNPFGMGFLYVRRELVEKLEPSYDTYFNVELPSGYQNYVSYLENPSRTPFDPCPNVRTAMKFEIGAYKNYIGILGLTRAIEILLDIGLEKIEEKIISLNIRLTEGLKKIGVDTCSSKNRKHMSSTVSFNLGLKDGKSSREKELVDYLISRGLIVSLRCAVGTGGIRVSMHHYTTENDIDSLLFHVEEFLRMKRPE